MYTRFGIEKRGFKFFEPLKMHTKAENLYFGFVFKTNHNFYQALAKYELGKKILKKFQNFNFGLKKIFLHQIYNQIGTPNHYFFWGLSHL